MANTPTDIAQQALDILGCKETIGDIEEGSRAASICLRWYDQCMRQLQRSAHWDFARKQVPMFLLADATGNTPNVGNIVVQPWIYEYVYPADCLKARFVPATPYIPPGSTPPGNISGSSAPLFGSPSGTLPPLLRLVPARWLSTNDVNYPVDTSIPQWWEQEGFSPAGRRVICTNQICASLVYTQYMPYINMWDARFREAMVHYLASEIVLALGVADLLGTPKQQQLALRTSQHQLAAQRVQGARQTDGNEGVSSTDSAPDWIRIRGSYGGMWGGGAGAIGGAFTGVTLYAGWDASFFGNGGAY